MKEFKLIMAVLLVIVLAMLGPFLVIWSLNTLFPVLAIGYTLETWVAVVLLFMFFKGVVKVKKD